MGEKLYSKVQKQDAADLFIGIIYHTFNQNRNKSRFYLYMRVVH